MCSFSSILHHLNPLFGPYPSLLQRFPFLLKLPLLSYIHLQHLNRLFLLRFIHCFFISSVYSIAFLSSSYTLMSPVSSSFSSLAFASSFLFVSFGSAFSPQATNTAAKKVRKSTPIHFFIHLFLSFKRIIL